ncbi:MAG: amidohydrolase family protein [Microvirga sp.]|nr:amidohydrolase family protein [Microvirga sp.]
MLTIIRNGTVFDGERVHERADVAIRGDAIEAVGRDLPAGSGESRVIDATGKFVMPGMIDAHTHLALAPVPERKGEHPQAYFYATRQARVKLASGVTTVRDVGGISHVDIALKGAIQRGMTPGPRMLCAGQFITATGGHCHYFADEADGADAIRRATRIQLKAGADLIKIMVSGGVANLTEPPERLYMQPDEIAAAVAEAHAAGRRVAAHAHPAKGIALCARLGVDTIEHGAFIDDEAIDAMLAAGTALIPTEAVYRFMADASDRNYSELAPVARRICKDKTARLKHAVARGVKIGVGTDCGRHFPYDAIAAELEHLVAAGLSGEAVLRAVTAGNAEILGISGRIGTLAPGMIADVILLGANPLDDIGATRSVDAIMQGGEVLDPASLVQTGRTPSATQAAGS